MTRLLKKLDVATGNHADVPLPTRLGNYLLLLCESDNREADLTALAKKEKIQHTLLSLLYIDPEHLGALDGAGLRRVLAKVGSEAEVTVVLASDLQVRACFAYRKSELNDKEIDEILAGLSKILPKKE